MFLKNRKNISKMKRSKVTDYAALHVIYISIFLFVIDAVSTIEQNIALKEAESLHQDQNQFLLPANLV